ncbi:MAG: hypothetical protein, partial [Olavius algarvensis Delta 4 endosymbiont]
ATQTVSGIHPDPDDRVGPLDQDRDSHRGIQHPGAGHCHRFCRCLPGQGSRFPDDAACARASKPRGNAGGRFDRCGHHLRCRGGAVGPGPFNGCRRFTPAAAGHADTVQTMAAGPTRPLDAKSQYPHYPLPL